MGAMFRENLKLKFVFSFLFNHFVFKLCHEFWWQCHPTVFSSKYFPTFFHAFKLHLMGSWSLASWLDPYQQFLMWTSLWIWSALERWFLKFKRYHKTFPNFWYFSSVRTPLSPFASLFWDVILLMTAQTVKIFELDSRINFSTWRTSQSQQFTLQELSRDYWQFSLFCVLCCQWLSRNMAMKFSKSTCLW